MIPILYDSTETIFSSNGLGRLSDAISCEVREKRNGTYELTLTYPENGIHAGEITDGCYIAVIHSDRKDIQPFKVYRILKGIDGQIEVNAHHISYALNSIVVKPFTAGTCAEAIAKLNTSSNFVNTCPFSFWTDKSVTASFSQDVPRDVRSLLGGASGSFLDIFGTGEYEFDKYNVKFYLHRGSDTQVQIRYGVNLTDYEHTADSSETYNAVVPFWQNEDDGIVVTLPEWYLTPTGQTPTILRLYPMDLSSDFEEQPTQAQLRSLAQDRLDNSQAWKPKENWKVSFVQLWQTPEYEHVAALQRLNLCDTCLVIYGNQTIREKVIEVVYDVLRERYTSMELGEPKSSFAEMIMQETTSSIVKQVVSKTLLEQAIDHATEMITGANGGNIVINLDANGRPTELLIMDNIDKAQAVNVWRWNLGGLGHSHNGYNGPFNDIALTADGQINASAITTGVLNAIRIVNGSNFVVESDGSVTAKAINILGGSVNIRTATQSTDVIKLSYEDAQNNIISTTFFPYGINCESDEDGTKSLLRAGGLRMTDAAGNPTSQITQQSVAFFDSNQVARAVTSVGGTVLYDVNGRMMARLSEYGFRAYSPNGQTGVVERTRYSAATIEFLDINGTSRRLISESSNYFYDTSQVRRRMDTATATTFYDTSSKKRAEEAYDHLNFYNSTEVQTMGYASNGVHYYTNDNGTAKRQRVDVAGSTSFFALGSGATDGALLSQYTPNSLYFKNAAGNNQASYNSDGIDLRDTSGNLRMTASPMAYFLYDDNGQSRLEVESQRIRMKDANGQEIARMDGQGVNILNSSAMGVTIDGTGYSTNNGQWVWKQFKATDDSLYMIPCFKLY